MAKARKTTSDGTIAANPKAWHNFEINEIFEAGLLLLGSEVKAMRQGGVSIKEAYVGVKSGSLHVLNMHVPELKCATHGYGHHPRRPRALLLHRREQNRLLGAIERKGFTLLALKLYFNAGGLAKLQIGLGKGKTRADKRAIERDRSWGKQKAQILRRGIM